MYNRLLSALNIRHAESALVSQLFLIQFFIGIATAFLFTGSLSLFLSAYPITSLPKAYILSGILLIFINQLYARMDERFSSLRLLRIVIIFAALSTFIFWALLFFTGFKLPIFLLASWNIIIYMLVGYAFWGLTSLLFNVRESKRLFSLVGAGDIPAKMLGYVSVYVIVPFTGSINLLWICIAFFLLSLVLINRVGRNKKILLNDPSQSHDHNGTHHAKVEKPAGVIERFFHNRLIFVITALTFFTNIIFAFIDFTFLSEIKLNYTTAARMAAFIGMFFGVVRFMALLIKLLVSSRVIARLGLANSLLLAPLLLLVLDIILIFSPVYLASPLYLFGMMVLVSEVLRSTLQEPVFFILFQPLGAHSRLKGHLIAKGYALQFALLIAGAYLYINFLEHSDVSIIGLARLLLVVLLCWLIMVYVVRHEYFQMLKTVLKRGYFTGTDLFLNDDTVIKVLLEKTRSGTPTEVIHSLALLERSGYADIQTIWLEQLTSGSLAIKNHVISKLMEKHVEVALPALTEQFLLTDNESLKGHLTRAIFYFEETGASDITRRINELPIHLKGQALTGLLLRNNPEYNDIAATELNQLAEQTNPAEKLVAIETIAASGQGRFTGLLGVLLDDPQEEVYKAAMEAVGKTGNFELVNRMISTSVERKEYHAIQRAVLLFGDPIFDKKYIQPIINRHKEVYILLVKAAAKIQGGNSDRFLLNALADMHIDDNDNDLINSLWIKGTEIDNEARIGLNQRVDTKLHKSLLKLEYLTGLLTSSQLKLLQEALVSEASEDLQVIIKGFGLLYDRENVKRIIELLLTKNREKISNAVELLELITPRKSFIQVNRIIEFLQEGHHREAISNHSKTPGIAGVFEAILGSNLAGCNTWTRTVACYLLPQLGEPDKALSLLHTYQPGDARISVETKGYVLSLLNHKL